MTNSSESHSLRRFSIPSFRLFYFYAVLHHFLKYSAFWNVPKFRLCVPVRVRSRLRLLELSWHEKTAVPQGNPVPVPLCPPQILHALTWDRTLVSAAKGWLTAWVMIWPFVEWNNAFYLQVQFVPHRE
jgi:hypothetical protein